MDTYALMGGPSDFVAVGPFEHEEAAADWGDAHERDGWRYCQSIRVSSIDEWLRKGLSDGGS